ANHQPGARTLPYDLGGHGWLSVVDSDCLALALSEQRAPGRVARLVRGLHADDVVPIGDGRGVPHEDRVGTVLPQIVPRCLALTAILQRVAQPVAVVI